MTFNTARRRWAEGSDPGLVKSTEMFTASDYANRVVGYLKVDVYSAALARSLITAPRQLSRQAQTSYYYIEILSDGRLGKKFDDHGPASTDILLPASYIFSTTTDVGDKKDDTTLEAQIPDFVKKIGFTFNLAELNTKLIAIRADILAKTYAPYKLTIVNTSANPAAPTDGSAAIFNSLADHANIAFFLVDLAATAANVAAKATFDAADPAAAAAAVYMPIVNIYVCKNVDGKYIVDWNTAVPAVPADWSAVWSYIPFCTVKDLTTQVNDTDIKFYPRTKTDFTGGEVAAAADKKIPPPFNLANRSMLGVSKTFKDRLNDAKKKLQTVEAKTKYDGVRNQNDIILNQRKDASGLSGNKEFLQKLNDVGCMAEPDKLLGDDACEKIKNIIEKATPKPFASMGGGRSKRNKHRRNKRTVSHRGRGHKRSRRVDGGSRKCGKKCRRKHTRK